MIELSTQRRTGDFLPENAVIQLPEKVHLVCPGCPKKRLAGPEGKGKERGILARTRTRSSKGRKNYKIRNRIR